MFLMEKMKQKKPTWNYFFKMEEADITASVSEEAAKQECHL